MDMKKLLSIVDGQASTKPINTNDMKKFVSIVAGAQTTKQVVKESTEFDAYIKSAETEIKEIKSLKKEIIDENVQNTARRVADKIKERHGLLEGKKPSEGMTKKEKSAVVKKAKAGDDIGKKGKGFEKVAKKAAEKYGSKEKGEKVAAAAMWKQQAKESINHKLDKMLEDIQAMKEYLNQLDEGGITLRAPGEEPQPGDHTLDKQIAMNQQMGQQAAQKTSTVSRYTPGVTYPAAYTISYNGNEYKFAGRDKDGPGTGEIIVVGAGAIGIRGLAPTKVELGKDGMYYMAGKP